MKREGNKCSEIGFRTKLIGIFLRSWSFEEIIGEITVL